MSLSPLLKYLLKVTSSKVASWLIAKSKLMVFQDIYPHGQCCDTLFFGRSSACIIHFSLLRNTFSKGKGLILYCLFRSEKE